MQLRVALPVPVYREFDYLAPEEATEARLKPGARIKVPFAQRKLIGIITEVNIKSELPVTKLKSAFKVLDDTPSLDAEIIKLCNWVSSYYQVPVGEALQLAVPKALRKKNSITIEKKYIYKSMADFANAKRILARAPKQLKLLEFILNNNGKVSNSLLNENFDNWQVPLKELRKKNLISREIQKLTKNKILDLPKDLNPEQKFTLDNINVLNYSVNLLYGVTGSGKTEVYLQLIAKVINSGRQALVLIPEISLSPQTLLRFQQRFKVKVAAQHSKMADGQRYKSWLGVKTGAIKILIATRSGIFNQFQDLGLIIVDEEHDASFKQQDGARYSARDLAILRARNLDIPVVLGSATPSLESLKNAWYKDYKLFKLTQRANKAKPPKLLLEDLRFNKSKDIFTRVTLDKINNTLKQNLQVLVFINRRGYAPVFYCNSCGYIKKCKRCDAHMVLHKNPERLVCHHCGSIEKLNGKCDNCGSDQFLLLGFGTARVEKRLNELLPKVKIIRIDRDSTRKRKSWDQLYDDIRSDKPCVLVGTQMLAKGHHFPNVALVVVLNADQGLLNTDFRASEHLTQLITQVAGRAGRDKYKGEVILQTMQPDNKILNTLLQHGYIAVAKMLLKERKIANFPPVTCMCLIRAESHKANLASKFLQEVKNIAAGKNIEKLGPLPAAMEKRSGKYHYQLILQAENKKSMQIFLHKLVPKITATKSHTHLRWSVDVDPVSMY